ncbi:deleted in malignant brain tumors 1 protein-like [Pelobates fuscus]|uniref:deleted in malignant brain tumors 1 protein-like n=1 Tax=Pelobates fuscus TaxID=191477 RepID=UPI002FE43901
MELALPLSCYLMWFYIFGLSADSVPRSSLVTFQDESVSESGETCKGIVLLTANQSSSLVCDSLWSVDSPLAHVVCQESGCGKPNHTWTLQSVPHLDAVQGVQCTGDESSVRECEDTGHIQQNCTLQSIAALTCNQNIKHSPGNCFMRLSKGRSSCDGHIEVMTGNTWSPACFTGIKDSDPQVLCQQMNCTYERPAFSSVYKHKSRAAVMIQCQGNQTSVCDCYHHSVNICQPGLTTYLQCSRPRMDESWLVWAGICLAAMCIVAMCWVRATKSWKRCAPSLYRNIRSCLSCPSNTYERGRQNSKRRRNIYETPNLVVQETSSPPSSPTILQNPTEVNALLAPHGFRLNNTITPPPSYMHALKILSRPLENSQTPPPSYLEALKILSRPVLVHVHAEEDCEEKEDLTAYTYGEKEGNTQDN